MHENRDYPLYVLPEIHDLCEMLVQKIESNPNGIAFAWYKKDSVYQKTYLQFGKDVVKTADDLRMAGCGSCNIGIIGMNSYGWLVLFMAIILSGNTVVPLDKDMTKEELRDVLVRMDIRRIAIDKRFEDAFNAQKLKVDCLSFLPDCDHDFVCRRNKEDVGNQESSRYQKDIRNQGEKDITRSLREVNINSSVPACIFLTSGTTGKRKGVVLTNENIAADINGSCRLFELKGNTLAILPFHHAFGLIVAVWMVFHYGYTVYISQGLRWIRKELLLVKPQTMMLVPAFVNTFYKQIEKLSCSRTDPLASGKTLAEAVFGDKLEYIICGGAFLDEQYVKSYRAFGIEILNGYGTTECSPVAAVNRNHYHKDGTVGLGLPDTKISVSEDGEILIAGKHVMKGYYNDPDATSEVLKNGWYYTGDLGYIDDDGFIKLTGRKKNLIILASGENISPEEMEEKLLHFNDINEAVVYADERGIVAEVFTELKDGAIENIKSEIEGLNKTLPMYKRIIDVHFRETPFLKTTSGKIIKGEKYAGNDQRHS